MASVPDRIEAMVQQWPRETAHRLAGGAELTFNDWWALSNRCARGLRELGVGREDRVALLFDAEDLVPYLVTYLAVHKLAAVNVILNKRFGAQELSRLLEHAEPTALVASNGQKQLLDDLDRDVLEAVELVTTGEQGRRWDELLSDAAGDLGVEIGDEDPADVLYTSGTTGRPKGVLSRHGNATQAPDELPEEFRGTGWLHASPLESLASISFIATPPALGMTTTWLAPPFDPERWLDIVESGDVTATFVVPMMVERILDVDGVEDRDLSSLTLVTIGSAPIAPATLRHFNDLLPNATPQISYSLTELGTGFTFMPEEEFDDHLDSVGKPMPPLEVRIEDRDTRDELPPGEIGEVVARVEGQTREYFRRPDLNAEAFDEDGWFRTDDLGHLDEEGFLYLHGRLDEVIMRGGYNIHPADPERAIYEHDDVREAAVFGVPDETQGELAVAAVVPRDGAGLSAEDLEAFLEDRLGQAKRPDRVEIVERLPRNADGKVLKRELTERFG